MSSNAAAGVFGRTRGPDEAWLARAEAEPALEPDLAIIDTYQHFWHRNDQQRYFLEDYAKDLADSGHKVVATVAVECGAMYRSYGPDHLRSVDETEFLVGIAAQASSGMYTSARVAAAIIGNADLTRGDAVREVLEAHQEAANGRLRGVKSTAKWDPDPNVRGTVGPGRPGLYLEPSFQKGVAQLAALGLSFDASIYHHQITDLIALARAHPQLSIAVIHAASPLGYGSYVGRHAEVHANWLAGMTELASCPNVCIKLGGLLMTLANFDFTKAAQPPTSEQLAALWRPYIEPCVELFGADRCMAAANFPTDKAGIPYGTVWNMFKSVMSGCSDTEKRWIFSDTARRVYRIDIDDQDR